MSPERLQAVLAQRADPRALQGIAGGEGATLEASLAYRVTVTTTSEGGRRSAAEAVILLLDEGDEPYRVLSWRNAADGSTAPQRTASR
jgi:general secretion pathway protein K